MKKASILFYSIIINLFIINTSFSADQKIPSWIIDNSKSKIEFIAAQNTTQLNGSFTKFAGIINFSKTDLKNSNVKISIDLNSFQVSLPDAVRVLKEEGWFDVKKFANAEFKSQKFSQISENKFRSFGTLKLKGIEMPVNIDFSFTEYSSIKAVAMGEAKINRLDFSVGKKDENGVKDSVVIKFNIVAIAKQ